MHVCPSMLLDDTREGSVEGQGAMPGHHETWPIRHAVTRDKIANESGFPI